MREDLQPLARVVGSKQTSRDRFHCYLNPANPKTVRVRIPRGGGTWYDAVANVFTQQDPEADWCGFLHREFLEMHTPGIEYVGYGHVLAR